MSKKSERFRSARVGTCPVHRNSLGYECGRSVLLRKDGTLRRHRTWEGYYCEEGRDRKPRIPEPGSVRKLTKKELRDLREGTVKYVVRFQKH